MKFFRLPLLLGCAFFAIALFLVPFLACADSYGDRAVFNIDKNRDLSARTKLAATLVLAGGKIYFYADDQWWETLPAAVQAKYSLSFRELDAEFVKNIYPKLTALFGSDVNPAVDREGKITVLFHPMISNAVGYFNIVDGYSKYVAPVSNEREMMYFNSQFVGDPLAKVYLAHEFTHLITFNQKDRLRNVSDDVWINEARAEYSSTVLGYDYPYSSSNFEQQVRSFSADSSKSLVVWAGKSGNFGAAHLFMQYLVDHYGASVLKNSMVTEKTGIASINYALQKEGFDVDFTRVFRNWLVALIANDCNLGTQYCYKFPGLEDFKVAPRINYLPNAAQLSLSAMYETDYFSGNWQKIVGGGGNLTLDFSGAAAAKFAVPYLLCYAGGAECEVGDMAVGSDGKAALSLPDFGRQYESLTLMPFAAGKTTMFGDNAAGKLPYSLNIAISPKSAVGAGQIKDDSKPAAIAALEAQIEALKKQIAALQAVLAARAAAYSCNEITANLYFGVENFRQVSCLQQVLKAQGASIYSGAATGRFSIDTQAAVIRFQEKYASEILVPAGLKKGTGYVGSLTRAKINKLLSR